VLNGYEREMSTQPTLRRGMVDFTFYPVGYQRTIPTVDYSPGPRVRVMDRFKLGPWD